MARGRGIGTHVMVAIPRVHCKTVVTIAFVLYIGCTKAGHQVPRQSEEENRQCWSWQGTHAACCTLCCCTCTQVCRASSVGCQHTSYHTQSEADARTRDWTLGMMAYEKILTSLTEITSQQQRSAASEEASDASGGGAAPSQSKKGGGKKRARTSTSAASLQGADAADADNSNEAQGAQPSSSSGSDSEVEAPVRKRVTHRGRFKKREASKAVSNYSCEDLTAIIGAASSFPDLTAINAVQRTAPPHDTSDEEAEKGGGNGMDDVDDVHGHTQAPMRHVIQGPPTPPPEEEDQSTAWWRNYFCRSGRLGSARTNTKRVKKVRDEVLCGLGHVWTEISTTPQHSGCDICRSSFD